MSKKGISWGMDIVFVLVLFYVWAWVGVWFNQEAMRSPDVFLPITQFTEGHLAATVVGVLEWNNDSLFDFYTDDIGWPDGLRFRPMMWPTIVLGILLNPVYALNLVWSYTLACNAVCGFFLVRVLGLSRVSALVAGSLMAWNPWVRTTLSNGQFEQSYVGIIALLWGMVLLAEKKPKIGIMGTFVVVLLGGLAVPNCLLTGLMGLPLLGIWRIVGNFRRTPMWCGCALAAICAGLMVNSYQSEGFDSDEPQFFAPRRADDASMSNTASWESLWSAPTESYANNQVAHITYQGEIWPRIGVLGGVLGGGLGHMGAAVAFELIHIALGPTVEIEGNTYYLPVSWLAYYVPILGRSGSYYRFAMGGFVSFALCGAAFIDRVRRFSLVLAIGVGAYVLQEAWTETNDMIGHPIPMTASMAFPHTEVDSLRGGKGPVLGLPLLKNSNCDKEAVGYVKEYWQHQRPILHTMAPPVRYRSNEPKIARLLNVLDDAQCSSKVEKTVQRMGIGAVILYLDGACTFSSVQKQCLIDGLGAPQMGRDVWIWDGLLSD